MEQNQTTQNSKFFNDKDKSSYGEKIQKIQYELTKAADFMLDKDYSCYLYHNDNSDEEVVESYMCDLNQPNIPLNKLHSACNILNKEDCNKIINFVTVQILYEWLCNDTNAQQTINSFANYGSKEKNENKSRQTEIDIDSKRKRLERNNKQYNSNWLFAKDETDNENPDETSKKDNSPKPYNFTFLTILD